MIREIDTGRLGMAELYNQQGSVSAWTDSPTSDSALSSYWSSTYHSSLQYGATATLQFQGVAVYLYDAYRWQHGQFTIFLDGQDVHVGNFSNPVSSFKVLMYSAEGLSPTWHNLTVLNSDPSNDKYTEIDFVTWTTSMNSSLYEVYGTDIPHTPGNMTYSSLAAWTEEQDGVPTMVTSTYGASVTINFEGNGIILNGKTGPTYGQFSVQIDGGDALQFNSNSKQTHDTVLFRQDSLADGNHTLVVTNKGYASLSIGSATPVVWSTTSTLPAPNSNSNPNSNSDSTSQPPTGLIAGVVVGGVVLLALFTIFLVWIFRRRNQQSRNSSREDIDGGDMGRATPAFIHTTPFVLPASTPRQSLHNTHTSRRDSKFGGATGLDGSPYHAVPGSPGMSSRGSFEVYGPAGQGSSSGGGSTIGGPAWGVPRVRDQRHSVLGIHNGLTEDGEDPLRDRDAGPVLLPQLPPAYSDPPAQSTSVESPEPPSGPTSTDLPTKGSARLKPGPRP